MVFKDSVPLDCVSCATKKPTAPMRRVSLKSIIVGYPLQFLVVDILGSLPQTSSSNGYILVAGYYFTRKLEAWPIPNQETKMMAEKLLNEMLFISLYQIWFCQIKASELKVHSLHNYVMYYRQRQRHRERGLEGSNKPLFKLGFILITAS